MTENLFQRTDLDRTIASLKQDLLDDDGPRISTMRNHRFAIVPYLPTDEYRLRQHIHRLSAELRHEGWVVLSISLQKLLLERVRSLGDRNVQRLIDREKMLFEQSPEQAINYLKGKLARHIEGPDGIAADVSHAICAFADAHPDKAERAVAFVGRAGALYPFFRTSALLKHLDGRTRGIPVVLLYPGLRTGHNSLSFMGEVPADTDYRPRIYT